MATHVISSHAHTHVKITGEFWKAQICYFPGVQFPKPIFFGPKSPLKTISSLKSPILISLGKIDSWFSEDRGNCSLLPLHFHDGGGGGGGFGFEAFGIRCRRRRGHLTIVLSISHRHSAFLLAEAFNLSASLLTKSTRLLWILNHLKSLRKHYRLLTHENFHSFLTLHLSLLSPISLTEVAHSCIQFQHS